MKIKYCIKEQILLDNLDKNKSQLALKYDINYKSFLSLTKYKLSMNKVYLEEKIEEKYLDPVIFYPKTGKIVRFKDAKKEEELIAIKKFKENNEKK